MCFLAAEQDRGDRPPHDQDKRVWTIPRSEQLAGSLRFKHGIDRNVRFQRPTLLLVVVQDDGIDDFVQIRLALENTHSRVIDGLQIEKPIVTTTVRGWTMDAHIS